MKALSAAVIVLALVFLASCGPSPDTSTRVFSELITESAIASNDVVGTWMIDSQSLDMLLDAEAIRVFTNTTDHIFVVKPDGDLIFRGLPEYSPLPHGVDERQRYDDWISELWHGSMTNHQGGYYLWSPTNRSFISGPFLELPDTKNGIVLKTKYTHWDLARHIFTRGQVSWNGWYLEMSARPDIGVDRRFRVGRLNDGRICLWQSAYEEWPKDEGRDTVRFLKIAGDEPASARK